MNQLSPVVLFAYNRPDHLKITLDLLNGCDHFDQSELYVFCDGAKDDADDRQKVDEVNLLLTNYRFNCQNVYFSYSKVNRGLSHSVISGVNSVFEDHQQAIVLEDDISISPHFLKIMNELLCEYQTNECVGSLSGYLYPTIVHDKSDDFFLLPRVSSWGWATWKDRWVGVDWTVKDFGYFITDQKSINEFNQGGEDLTPMLWKWKYGINDSWAVRWSYHHYKLSMGCVFSKTSLVLNHGNDGSGTHSPNSKKFDNSGKYERPFTLPSDINFDSDATLRLRKFFKLSLFRKVLNYFVFQYNYRVKTHS